MQSSTNGATSSFTSTLASAPSEIGKNFAIKLSGSSSTTDLRLCNGCLSTPDELELDAPSTACLFGGGGEPAGGLFAFGVCFAADTR